MMTDPRFLQEGFENQLNHFMEECAEAITAGCKINRWGAFSVNPLLPPEEQETNIVWLRKEIEDVALTAKRLLDTMNKEFTHADLYPHSGQN